MADKISDLLIKIATDTLDNMDEHLKLRQKHNLGQIQALDQKERVTGNLRQCFELIKRKEDYFHYMHNRTLKEQEARASFAKAPTQQIEDEESEEDDQLDEEELEAIRKQSMAGLFLSFNLPSKDEPKKKKKPPLPPRDDISEDSMEDMVSDIDAENAQ